MSEINNCTLCETALRNEFGEVLVCPECGAQYEYQSGESISQEWATAEIKQLREKLSLFKKGGA